MKTLTETFEEIMDSYDLVYPKEFIEKFINAVKEYNKELLKGDGHKDHSDKDEWYVCIQCMITQGPGEHTDYLKKKMKELL